MQLLGLDLSLLTVLGFFYLGSVTFYFHDYLYFCQLYYRHFVHTRFFFIIRSQTQSASVTSKSSFTNPESPHPSQATVAFEKGYQMSSHNIPRGIQIFLLCRSGRMRHWSLSAADTILQARTNPNSHLSFSLSHQHLSYILSHSIQQLLHGSTSPSLPSCSQQQHSCIQPSWNALKYCIWCYNTKRYHNLWQFLLGAQYWFQKTQHSQAFLMVLTPLACNRENFFPYHIKQRTAKGKFFLARCFLGSGQFMLLPEIRGSCSPNKISIYDYPRCIL